MTDTDPTSTTSTLYYGARDGETNAWLWRIFECTVCGNALVDPDRHDAFYHPDTDNTLPVDPPVYPDHALPDAPPPPDE